MSRLIQLQNYKKDFPIFNSEKGNPSLVYLDSAATTLKPKPVIERINQFNSFETANVHRGAYDLSDQATTLYENAREKVAKFLNAASSSEIIFTRGTTESINLVANSVSVFLKAGDEILLTEMEHHANIVPWQMLAEKMKLNIKVLPINDDGSLKLELLPTLLSQKVKIFAFTHASNHIGTINDAEFLISEAKKNNTLTLVDGAQMVGKHPIDLQKLGADFYAFSGHKMFAPFGIGVLYGKSSLLNQMPPYQGGGSMIDKVTFEKTTYNDIPFRFEAGTPNVEGAVALHSAIDYIESLGWQNIESHLNSMTEYAFASLNQFSQIKWIGTKFPRSSLLSFIFTNIHHADIGAILNEQNVAVRIGHHCTQPLLKHYGITGSIRASFSIYNDESDINRFIVALKKAQEILS